MKKKIQYVLLLCLMAISLTGCVKFDVNMNIKRNKSMEFSMVYGIDQSIMPNQELSLSEEEKQEYEDLGFSVEDYSEGTIKGYRLSRKFSNIDSMSTDKDVIFNFTSDTKPAKGNMFKIKKGLFKNTYTAKFKFDFSDLDYDNTDDDSNYSFDYNYGNNDYDYGYGDDFDYSDIDMSSYLNAHFNVNLPHSAKSNNATTAENHNKKLSWDLASQDLELIEFQFELYNYGNIIFCGLAIIAILGIIVVLINSMNKNNKKNNNMKRVQEMNTYSGVNHNMNSRPMSSLEGQNVNSQMTQNPMMNSNTNLNANQPTMTNSSVNPQMTQTPMMSSNMNTGVVNNPNGIVTGSTSSINSSNPVNQNTVLKDNNIL